MFPQVFILISHHHRSGVGLHIIEVNLTLFLEIYAVLLASYNLKVKDVYKRQVYLFRSSVFRYIDVRS